MKTIFSLTTFVLLLLFSSCKKIHYYPDKIIPHWNTKSIAHRAGGNSIYRENTLESAMFALNLSTIDGIETDVQISKSNTVWMSHNTKVISCDGEERCFFSTWDKDIELIDSCKGMQIKYTKLETTFAYMHAMQIKKMVSIDLKSWTACGINGLDVEGTMRFETEQIINLSRKYELEDYLLFESETASVLNWVQKNSNKAQTYYLEFDDLERGMLVALENNFTGISYDSESEKGKLNKSFIELLHKKGLRLMAWHIISEERTQYLKEIGVDILQVDLP